MELSSSKIKKVLVFLEIDLFSSKIKNFLIFPEITFSYISGRDFPSSKNKKSPLFKLKLKKIK